MERVAGVPRLPERTGALLLIKHDLASDSSVMPSLIFDDALHFSVCAPFHLFKRSHDIGQTAVTVTDGPPGGCSAVAKISNGGRRERIEPLQMWGDETLRSTAKKKCKCAHKTGHSSKMLGH